MIIASWRIVKKKYVLGAFDGKGAFENGGRWNSAGVLAVYTSDSVASAMLEMLVHLESDLASAYCVIPASFDEGFVQAVRPSSLPRRWREYPAPGAVTRVGDAWLATGTSAVLQVPSAIVPGASNFILNPIHRDFKSIAIGAPMNLPLDPRLLKRK